MRNKSKGKDKNRSIDTNLRQSSDCTNAIKSDVLGSYTGICVDGEAPVQDADDL